MPHVPLSALADRARVWVFGSDRPLTEARAERLLAEVDAFLASWSAHGAPLLCAMAWTFDRFLTIAVDEEATGASGCSIDGLFRVLQRLQPVLGATLTDRSFIYYRDADSQVQCVSREEFAALAGSGQVDDATRVFDPTVATLGDWRTRFETRTADSWHAHLTTGTAA
ncbi:MAG: hypothetical protein NVS4B3_12190 [Gemmatimonadaceae bacterium]